MLKYRSRRSLILFKFVFWESEKVSKGRAIEGRVIVGFDFRQKFEINCAYFQLVFYVIRCHIISSYVKLYSSGHILPYTVWFPFVMKSLHHIILTENFLFQVVNDLLNPAGQNLRIREDLQVCSITF